MDIKVKSHLKPCAAVSIAIMVVALVMTLTGHGMNLGVDFTGGTMMTIAMHQDFDSSVVTKAFVDEGFSEKVIVGVVGVLQFEVLEYRLNTEYKVDIRMQELPYEHIRWIENDPDELNPKDLDLTSDTRCIEDLKGNHLLLFTSEWSINWAQQHNEALRLSEFGNL